MHICIIIIPKKKDRSTAEAVWRPADGVRFPYGPLSFFHRSYPYTYILYAQHILHVYRLYSIHVGAAFSNIPTFVRLTPSICIHTRPLIRKRHRVARTSGRIVWWRPMPPPGNSHSQLVFRFTCHSSAPACCTQKLVNPPHPHTHRMLYS